MKTCSKPLLASMVTAVVLASQATVFAEPVGPAPKFTGIMGIVDMKIADERCKVVCPLSNKGATPLNVTYTFSKWNGSAWSPFKTGNTVIPAKGEVTIAIIVPRTKEVQRVRLDVSATGHISVAKELKMRAQKEKVYVLQYKTRGSVQIAYQYERTTSALIGQGVNAKMAEAKALGFETKRKTDTTTYVVGANAYRTYAYAKLDTWKEKTFVTKEERDTFKRNLYKLVPAFTANKQDPTKYGGSLLTKDSER